MSTPVYSDDLNRKLAAVNERLAAVEAQLAILSQAAGVPYTPPAAPSVAASVMELVRAGKRREAIAEHRRVTGDDLETAMKVVEAL